MASALIRLIHKPIGKAAIASLPDPSRCTARGSIRVRAHRVGRIAATDGKETIIDLPTQVNAVVSRTELGSSEPARRGGIGGQSQGGIETRHDSAGVEPAVINHRSGPTGGGKTGLSACRTPAQKQNLQ